jgi:hypothetical protein
MPARKSSSRSAWDQFQDDMKALGDEFRRQYEAGKDKTSSADVQEALNRLGKAADEVFSSLGKVTRDADVRAGTEKAARSFGTALAETFRQVADELADAVKSRR